MSAVPVAVTGLGLMTGLGLDLESTWRGLLEGRNAVQCLLERDSDEFLNLNR